MSMQKAVAGTGIAVAIIVMMTSALALLQPSTTITNTGAIEALNVSVYQDSACTQSLTALNWGTLRPGTSANRTIYVKNTGNAALTLNMTATAWNPPAASSYITLTWDRQSFATRTWKQGYSASHSLSISRRQRIHRLQLHNDNQWTMMNHSASRRCRHITFFFHSNLRSMFSLHLMIGYAIRSR